MIHRIWASDEQFKPVEFSAGLNVILAERTPESSQKDTRNGSGKTTLLDIIHFCLGADLGGLHLPRKELHHWAFFIRIDLCGETLVARRSIANARMVEVGPSVPGLPIFQQDGKGTRHYSNDEWKKLLGRCLFHLSEEHPEKYKPSFRSLVSYFIRRGTDAYIDPFKYFGDQRTYDVQIHNAYLLGLNWAHASEAQKIRDKQTAVKVLSSAMKAGMTPTQGELEAERVRVEGECERESAAIKSFNVHPQYKELQDRANRLTEETHELANTALVLRRKLERYRKAVSEEKLPEPGSVEKLFSEAGVHFPDNIKRSLKEAQGFHKAIVRNRKLFLEAEIAQIENELTSTNERIEKLSGEKAELLKLLETHGALEELTLLQGRVLEKERQLEVIREKISDLQQQAQRKKEIKASQIELETKLQRDYQQSRSEWEKAVALFNEKSQALYNEPGNLIINTTDKGYKFDVDIQKSGSEGVGKMKIFCYDLTLVELMKQRGGIDFLFHDSSIFDGVDSRQRALALMHASRRAEEKGFQYICALNSDMVPRNDFDKGFTLDAYVRRTLGDQRPEDTLLGFHFE